MSDKIDRKGRSCIGDYLRVSSLVSHYMIAYTIQLIVQDETEAFDSLYMTRI